MRCAVLGSPIRHSLSPAMHRAAYARLGLDWTYEAVEVLPDTLEPFVHGLDSTWRGLSLTMPLKRTVVPMVDRLDEWSRVSGVVNTLVFGDQRRLGFNTDVPGAMAAIVERVHDPIRSAVVLGGGATATSVLLALGELGCQEARLLVRDPARAEETVAVVSAYARGPRVSVGLLQDAAGLRADLVVSTVPASAQTPRIVSACDDVAAVFEVVYDPWLTPLLAAAEDTGRPAVGGLDLLAHQAALQVSLMTGRSVPVDLLRSAARAELARRAGAAAGS
ncbi:shikimate dehydrogenase [Nocardioides korecus]